MNARSLVLPLVFAAIVLFAFFFTDLGSWASRLVPEPSGSVPAELPQAYESRTLTFQDPVRGFSIRYPLGYPIHAEDGQSVTFFAPGPSGLSESFVWQVLNTTPSDKELEVIGVEEFQVDASSVKTVSISGRRITRIQYQLPEKEFGEPLHVVQGLVPCDGYALYFVASVPESLKDDLALADYLLYSAQCGPYRSDAV